MKKAAIAAAVVAVLVVTGLFVARSQVAAYYRTPEFQQEIKRLVGPEAQATPYGWFDFTVTGKGLKLNVDVDAVPRILTQKIGLRVSGTYGSGTVAGAAVVPLAVLLDDPPAGWKGPVGEGAVSEIDLCPWLGAKSGPIRCVSAKGGVTASNPPFRAVAKLGATSWRVEQPLKMTLTTKPLTAELGAEGDDVVLRQPVTLATSVGSATIAGRVYPTLALDVAAKGMIARAAVASLLQCRGIPAKDAFTVRGAIGAPQCQ